MQTPRPWTLRAAALFAACLMAAGCSGLPGPFDAASAAQSPAEASWTSITGTPASRPCGEACAPPTPAPQPAGVKPGEVWCYVKIPGEVRTRSERVLVSPGRWEWKRSRDCEPPGMAGAGAGAPEVRTSLEGGVRPGEVWCQVWSPPVYEERVTEEPCTPARWEWRRTSECDVPASGP